MLRTALLSVFTITYLAFQNTAFAEGPFQDLTYEAALKAAEKEKKIIVIDFYTTWCGPCKMLDKTTWKDDDVVAWFKKKAVGLKIDAEKEKALAKKFKINSYPTIILLKPDGKEIDRITGYRDAKQFLADVNASLSGNDSLSRAKAEADENPNDPMIRMKYGRELAQRGRNEEALKEYLWCFDEGEKNSRSFSGVRISFLLGNITQLGSKYPPALEALRERRDRNEKTVLDHFKKNAAAQKGKPIKKKPNARGFYEEYRTAEFDAVRESACDSAYISQNLGEADRAIKFYDKLRAIGEDAKPLRARMMFILFDTLADARR